MAPPGFCNGFCNGAEAAGGGVDPRKPLAARTQPTSAAFDWAPPMPSVLDRFEIGGDDGDAPSLLRVHMPSAALGKALGGGFGAATAAAGLAEVATIDISTGNAEMHIDDDNQAFAAASTANAESSDDGRSNERVDVTQHVAGAAAALPPRTKKRKHPSSTATCSTTATKTLNYCLPNKLV